MMKYPERRDSGPFDVVIIGGGVIGSAVAWALMRGQRRVAVLERGPEVCEGTSKANSGIVHAGFDATPGTLKAEMNVKGSRMMEALCRELDVPYRRNTSLVVGFSEEDRETLKGLLEKGLKNGVEGLKILTGDEARALEPNLTPEVCCALLAPTGAIVDPFLLTIALAENAFVNGAEFYFGRCVTKVHKEGEEFTVTCGDGETFRARCVVNCAGVYADEIHNQVSSRKLHIVPRKGEYMLMDRKTEGFVNATVFQCPTKMGKGVLVTPTVHGNLLLGPTSVDIEDKEGVNTTQAGFDTVVAKAGLTAKGLPTRQVITGFAGLRAHEEGGDFVLGEDPDCAGFFDAAGVESPGLTSAPAIGEYLAAAIDEKFPAPAKPDHIRERKGTPHVRELSDAEREALVASDPAYASVVCRCELITEGEILDAIRRPLGARTLDGIKRRVRAGMGRCQAGFCLPRQAEILAESLGIDLGDVVKSGENAYILKGRTKE